jgi:hypothetical protein
MTAKALNSQSPGFVGRIRLSQEQKIEYVLAKGGYRSETFLYVFQTKDVYLSRLILVVHFFCSLSTSKDWIGTLRRCHYGILS